jgi:hypothetical protein
LPEKIARRLKKALRGAENARKSMVGAEASQDSPIPRRRTHMLLDQPWLMPIRTEAMGPASRVLIAGATVSEKLIKKILYTNLNYLRM